VGPILAVGRYEEFVREHSPLLAVLFCVLLALLVVRLVVKTMTRFILLGTLLLLTLFVFVERDNIQECTQSCECAIAGFDVELPGCDPAPLAVS
jgi:predicted membrane metal-binding protein